MTTTYPPHKIIINDLAKAPHKSGQIVLKLHAADFLIEARREGERYCCYLFATSDGQPQWTRHAIPAATVADVRTTAARMLTNGLA